jgi:hypothetical protein
MPVIQAVYSTFDARSTDGENENDENVNKVRDGIAKMDIARFPLIFTL